MVEGARRRSAASAALFRREIAILRTSSTWSGLSFGRRPPGMTFRARAASSPARVRSRIIGRSNSAKLPRICMSLRPGALVVSTDSETSAGARGSDLLHEHVVEDALLVLTSDGAHETIESDRSSVVRPWGERATRRSTRRAGRRSAHAAAHPSATRSGTPPLPPCRRGARRAVRGSTLDRRPVRSFIGRRQGSPRGHRSAPRGERRRQGRAGCAAQGTDDAADRTRAAPAGAAKLHRPSSFGRPATLPTAARARAQRVSTRDPPRTSARTTPPPAPPHPDMPESSQRTPRGRRDPLAGDRAPHRRHVDLERRIERVIAVEVEQQVPEVVVPVGPRRVAVVECIAHVEKLSGSIARLWRPRSAWTRTRSASSSIATASYRSRSASIRARSGGSSTTRGRRSRIHADGSGHAGRSGSQPATSTRAIRVCCSASMCPTAKPIRRAAAESSLTRAYATHGSHVPGTVARTSNAPSGAS